jgi:hypothetical protein
MSMIVRALTGEGRRKTWGEPRPAVQRVGSLAGFHLDNIAHALATLCGSEAGDGITLGSLI